MRVALDASLLDGKTTGISLYARELSRSLEAAGATVEHWAAEHRRMWERRLDVLGDLLAEGD